MARDDGPPRLRGSDRPFKNLSVWWLPFFVEAVLHDLTFDEIHAIWLGLIGFPTGYVYATGGVPGQVAAIGGTVVLLSIAMFRLPHEAGISSRLLSNETWYFSIPYFCLASVGVFAGLYFPIPGVTP